MNKKSIISAMIALLASLGLGGYTIVKKSEISKTAHEITIVKIIDGDTIKIESEAMGTENVESV